VDEADGDIAGELEVLALVVAHRHPVRVVGEDVGGHEHRVVEQPDAHRLVPARAFPVGLVLELGHPAQLAHGGHAVEDPGELGVLAYVALHEQGAALRVESGREQEHHGAPGGVGEGGRLVGHGHRVEVDDAVEGVGGGRDVVLRGDPVPNRAQVVAEVLLAGGLDAREHA
jgi:hypothetical protein